jgi:hypothetical protein
MAKKIALAEQLAKMDARMERGFDAHHLRESSELRGL